MEILDWKLNASLYPCGLTHYESGTAVLVIVWSSSFLCTKKFRSFLNAIENNLPPDKDQILLIADTSISRIVTGTLESVILTETEKLMYFETAKILRKVEYVDNIKSICVSGQGFLILYISKEGNINIMIHPDSFPCQPEQLQTFDVSFEKTFCQTTWNASRFNIVSLQVNPNRPLFFNNLRKFPEEKYDIGDSFIFFSINNVLLSLVVEEDNDYRYHPIHTHSSNIRGIHGSKDFNSIYVLLESGVIDVIYSCAILGVIRTCSLFFMYEVGQYDICDDLFVYTDGFRLVLGQILYCSKTNTYKSKHKIIPVFGIAALTIVKACKKIICLSENRTFYKISYSDDVANANADTGQFISVKEFLSKVEKTTIDIAQLVDNYDSIKSELMLKNKMFEAIALKSNYKNDRSIFRIPMNAKLKMYRTIPDLSPTAIYPTTMHFDKNSYFLHIQIQPHRFGKCFSSNIWNLCIEYETHADVCSKVIRLFNEEFEKPLDILIILQIKQKILPPKVTLTIETSVKIGEDFLCISFPIITDVLDYKDIMRISSKVANYETISSSHRNASQLKKKSTKDQKLNYYIDLPAPVQFTDLLKIIDQKAPADLNSVSKCFVNLLGSNLEFTLDDSLSQICLTSCDAALMYHVKRQLIEFLRKFFNFSVVPKRERNVQKYIEECMYSK